MHERHACIAVKILHAGALAETARKHDANIGLPVTVKGCAPVRLMAALGDKERVDTTRGNRVAEGNIFKDDDGHFCTLAGSGVGVTADHVKEIQDIPFPHADIRSQFREGALQTYV